MKYPKIGVRPIIDSRLGDTRESLEETTMVMATRVAALFGDSIYYPDVSPVQSVIADYCIGGISEAEDCRKKFESENVGLSLSVTPCWAYGSEAMDMHCSGPKQFEVSMEPKGQVLRTRGI